jgi:hypothetical protein
MHMMHCSAHRQTLYQLSPFVVATADLQEKGMSVSLLEHMWICEMNKCADALHAYHIEAMVMYPVRALDRRRISSLASRCTLRVISSSARVTLTYSVLTHRSIYLYLDVSQKVENQQATFSPRILHHHLYLRTMMIPLLSSSPSEFHNHKFCMISH